MTDAERTLFDLFERWRRLSAAENQAIFTADWPHLERLQDEKRLLQPAITQANDLLQADLARFGAAAQSAQQRFRVLALELVAMERENDAALAAQQRASRQQQAELAQASRNLRQVHAAYVPVGRAGWQSYS